jgi:hypothetical protein
LERGKKDRRKKVKTQANREEKGHDRSQLDTKCQEFGYGHFVLQLDTQILCSFPPNKQSNNKHRQLKQISQECEACTASTESATKTAETMKHTQAGSTKLKAAAKPKRKQAQQESFQTPQQTQLN